MAPKPGTRSCTLEFREAAIGCLFLDLDSDGLIWVHIEGGTGGGTFVSKIEFVASGPDSPRHGRHPVTDSIRCPALALGGRRANVN